MKSLSYFFLIFVLFFFAACSDGIERIVPEADDHDTVDSGTDTGDTNHDTGDTADTDTGDTENPDTGDTENPDTGDTADTDTGDTADTDTGDTENPDTGDTADTDTGDTDYPDTGDTADTDTGDTDTDSESDREKCNNVGGTWDSSAKKCYVTVTCDSKPDNSEWNGDSSYKIYYDLNTEKWEPVTYATEYGDGEPQPCQYVCIANYGPEGKLCKPYCSAVFNGSTSQIAVNNDEKLSLGNTWTIEAWIKQDAVSTDIPAIVRKGNSYYLTAAYVSSGLNQKTYETMAGGFYHTSSTNPFAATVGINDGLANALNDGWNHIALSYYIEGTSRKTANILLYINGKKIAAKTDTVLMSLTPKTVTDALTIGYNEVTSGWSGVQKYYFNGKIDQLKISTNTYKNNFDTSQLQLSADNNTIAFWDFSNNSEESKNGLKSTPTDITYSTDCAF